MKKIILAAAVAACAVASPAFAAGEARLEARGGIAWAGGGSEAVAGVAGGYDFDLGETTFAGIEGSADKILAGGADVFFGITARAGAKLGNGKLYADVGYTFNNGDAVHAGAGYQHSFGEKMYGKVEYRRYFNSGTDLNAAVVGLGIKF
jgi:outer membrane immunogenic protein